MTKEESITTRTRLVIPLTMLLALGVSAGILGGFVFAQSGASNQDKAQACKDAADKQNLTGDARDNFMQTCLSKSAGTHTSQTAQTNQNSKVSEPDKAKGCNDLADKQNLTGANRRSFLKNCMNKATPDK